MPFFRNRGPDRLPLFVAGPLIGAAAAALWIAIAFSVRLFSH